MTLGAIPPYAATGGSGVEGLVQQRLADEVTDAPPTTATEPRRAGRRRGRGEHRGRGRRREPEPPGDLLNAVFRTPRSLDTSYSAYLRYRDSGGRERDLCRALIGALPVIREVCRTPDRALVGAAAWAIVRALQMRRFVTGGPREYWAYLRQTARGAVAHQRETDDRFRLVDRVSPGVCSDAMLVTGRVLGVRDVERKLVIEKIPVLVARAVVSRLPFDGEERAAALYILRHLLEGRDIVVRGLKVLFDLPCERLRILVDYVTAACRMALRRIRLELEAAGGNDLGWRGSLSMTAWLYGEDDDASPAGR